MDDSKPIRRTNNTRHPRRWIPYAAAALLVSLIVVGLWPKPVLVETARATLGKLRVTVDEEGKTRIRHRYLVSAPVAGQLRRILLKEGAEVKAGATLLATIDPVSPSLLDSRTRMLAEGRRDSASANLDKARASLNFARSELKRFSKLFADQTVSAQELDTVQLREAAAEKDQAAAEATLRQAEAELASFGVGNGSTNEVSTGPVEVKSPVDGRILRVFEENERVVAPGTPLLEVGDPTDLEVVVEVLSRDGAIILPGSKVEFEQWGGPQALEGKVRLIEPAGFTKVSALGVEEQRVKLVADLTTPPEQRASLGDQFRVEARVIIWETDQTLKVPAGALFRRGQQWGVFVVERGRAIMRDVTVGHTSGTETEISQGLQPGDEVILYPGSRVKAGQRVQAIKI
jgi:HlyD family secretion protein